MRKAVFTDRDGVLNFDPGYLFRIEEFNFYEGVPEAISKLNRNGYEVIVITNQSGVGRKYFTIEDVHKLHHYINSELSRKGARIDDYRICTHRPEENCECRKPNPFMIIQSAHERKISLEDSFVVGDWITDILAGKNAGCKTILVLTGKGEEALQKMKNDGIEADYVCRNFIEAVDLILKNKGKC